MASARLHLIMGLPGAGKSTLARIIADITGATVLSSDEMRKSLFIKPCFSQDEHDRLYGIIDHNLEHLLEYGKDVVYDANLNRYSHRKEKYDLAEKYNAHVILWWVATDEKLSLQRRITEQDHLLLPENETSEAMFERIASILEKPKSSESVIKIDGTNIKKSTVQDSLASLSHED